MFFSCIQGFIHHSKIFQRLQTELAALVRLSQPLKYFLWLDKSLIALKTIRLPILTVRYSTVQHSTVHYVTLHVTLYDVTLHYITVHYFIFFAEVEMNSSRKGYCRRTNHNTHISKGTEFVYSNRLNNNKLQYRTE